MRSSKSRSRGNKNRNTRPSGGNIINRVFESSGPDGKVRGTPQQIIEKYNQLHRDAQLTNDRVNAENFAQHAEHYTRMLAEAMREVDRAREEQEQQARDRQSERDRERQARFRVQEDVPGDPAQTDQPDLVGEGNPLDLADVAESGLVETPEELARRTERNDRRERQVYDRPQGDRPNGDRQDRRDRQDRPQGDRNGERQPQGEPRDNRQNENRQNDNRQNDNRQNENRQNEPRPDRGPRPDRRDRDRAPRPVEAEAAPELPAFLTTPTFVSEPVAAPTAPEPVAEMTAADPAPEVRAPKARKPRKPKEEAGQPEAAAE